MRFMNDKALDAVDASLALVNSPPIDASYIVAVSVQVVATGAPIGSVKLQASNDLPLQGPPLNWVDIPTATVAVSAAGITLIPKLDICYQFIRVVWTKTSGTGAITAQVKSIGF